jgi:hypothetical protein
MRGWERGTLPRLLELGGSSVLHRDQTPTPAASWHAVLCAGQSAFWQACPQQRAAAAAANLAGFEAVTKLCDGSGRGTASALAAPLGRFIEPSATIQ